MYTRLEVSNFSSPEDRKVDAKFENVVWGSYGTLKVNENATIRLITYDFLLRPPYVIGGHYIFAL